MFFDPLTLAYKLDMFCVDYSDVSIVIFGRVAQSPVSLYQDCK